VRLVASEATLDAAVAQTRALFARLVKSFASQNDAEPLERRMEARYAQEELAAKIDPRTRLLRLWREGSGAPPARPSGIAAFVAQTLKDEALVIVAARPGRGTPP
jgi:hypothetical protein